MGIMQQINKIDLFLPVSVPMLVWYLFVIAYMLTDLILTIIVQCFNNTATKHVLFQVINNILPIIQIIDILISFNTGFIKNGKIILNRKAANYEYVRTVYFYCDVIALVMSLLQVVFQNTILQGITIFNYIVFIKLMTAYYTDSLLRKYVIKSFTVFLYYEVAKNFIILALLCHIIGSFYFYIDVLMYENGWYPQNQLWIFNSYAISYVQIYTQDFWIQYTYSYYVACVTLSGTAYGDIVPLNPFQNLYIFGCFILPMLIYSYVYSSIFTALFNRRSTSATIRRYKFLAKEYLKSLGVTYKVMNKILTFLQFTYKKNMIVDTKFIEDLAPTIRSQYLSKMIEGKFDYECFYSILQISNLDQNYLKDNIYSMVKQQYFPDRLSLINTDRLKLYYINSGQVVEVVRLKQKKKLSKPITSHNHVGKVAFYTNQMPAQRFTYESSSFVIAHSIDYKQFRKIAKQKMPTLNQAFCLVQNRIIDEHKYDLMNQKCYFCDQITHILQNCPQLNFNRDSLHQEREAFRQQRKKINRDHTVKKPKLQKKNSFFEKPSSHFIDNNLNRNNRSKKIYVRNRKNIEGDVLNISLDKQFYQYLAEFSITHKNFTQQTLQKNHQNVIGKLAEQKLKYSMQKVCFWDNFYPEWNLIK